MWHYPERYDVIVCGAGHAGCEAALASARMGAKTLLLTMNLSTIAQMSCNPAIGGTAKGQVVREIDALGGAMGKVIDLTGIQYRMLNRSKGPAVWAPRAQADKLAYQSEMKQRLERQENLELFQGSVEDLIIEGDRLRGVIIKEGICFNTSALVLSAGTFMRGLLHIGDTHYSGGRAGDQPSIGLSAALERHNFKLGRLKTGTPPRVNKRSIDYSLTEEQPGDGDVRFSFDDEGRPRLDQLSCHITYTTAETKAIIQANLHRSPIYSGKIDAVGPRYCPSIEDKVVRFADKERHQIFLEPEGLNTNEVYVNGVSSSLPFDVQLQFIRSVPALRSAEIMRPAYAIEYDYLLSGQIGASLESRAIEGLYFAGQINGTTGYEEAAAQGLIAGINAASKARGLPPLILGRHEAYIGVMIDDLVTKEELKEPYRLFSSLAEYRLLLRQDNADLRLRRYGYERGIVERGRMEVVEAKQKLIDAECKRLAGIWKQLEGKSISLAQLLCRPENSYSSLHRAFPESIEDHGEEVNFQIEINLKYSGYIDRQKTEIAKLSHSEKIKIPKALDYSGVVGLSNEAQQKLGSLRPENLGQAARISGISPSDISVLMIALTKRDRQGGSLGDEDRPADALAQPI